MWRSWPPCLGWTARDLTWRRQPRKQTVSIPTPGRGLRNTVLEWDGRRMVWSVHSLGKSVLEQKLTLWFPLSFSGNEKASKSICRRCRVTFSFFIQVGTLLRVNGSIINSSTRATGINHVTLTLGKWFSCHKISLNVGSFILRAAVFSYLFPSGHTFSIPRVDLCDIWCPQLLSLKIIFFIVSEFGFKKKKAFCCVRIVHTFL